MLQTPEQNLGTREVIEGGIIIPLTPRELALRVQDNQKAKESLNTPSVTPPADEFQAYKMDR